MSNTVNARLPNFKQFQLPVHSRTLSSDTAMHLARGSVPAWDISAPLGTPVYPIAAGKVIYSGCNNAGGYGCWALLSHDDGYTSVYAHCEESPFVKAGDGVAQNQPLCTVGWTGMTSFGPHVHLEIRRNGGGLDPAEVFPIEAMDYCPFCEPTADIYTPVETGGAWGLIVVFVGAVGFLILRYVKRYALHACGVFIIVGLVHVGVGYRYQADFDSAYAFVAKWEGTRCVADPVEMSMRGVLQSTQNTYRLRKGLPLGDVCQITEPEAKAVYYELYWLPSGAADLPAPLAMAHFDWSVNAGVYRANLHLKECRYSLDILGCYLDRRETFYRSLKSFDLYGAGWMNRLADLRNEVQ